MTHSPISIEFEKTFNKLVHELETTTDPVKEIRLVLMIEEMQKQIKLTRSKEIESSRNSPAFYWDRVQKEAKEKYEKQIHTCIDLMNQMKLRLPPGTDTNFDVFELTERRGLTLDAIEEYLGWMKTALDKRKREGYEKS